MRKHIATAVALVFMQLFYSYSVQAQQPPDAKFRADVEKLLEVTGATALGTQMASLVSDQMIDLVKKTQPDVPDRAFTVIKEMLNAEFASAFEARDGLRGKLVASYMKHFSHDEVLGLLQFYSTDLGRKSISVMPALTQEGAMAGQEWAAANMGRISTAVEQRLRAEGFIK